MRRIATRYDKSALSCMSFLNLSAARLWIRSFVNGTKHLSFQECQSNSLVKKRSSKLKVAPLEIERSVGFEGL